MTSDGRPHLLHTFLSGKLERTQSRDFTRRDRGATHSQLHPPDQGSTQGAWISRINIKSSEQEISVPFCSVQFCSILACSETGPRHPQDGGAIGQYRARRHSCCRQCRGPCSTHDERRSSKKRANTLSPCTSALQCHNVTMARSCDLRSTAVIMQAHARWHTCMLEVNIRPTMLAEASEQQL